MLATNCFQSFSSKVFNFCVYEGFYQAELKTKNTLTSKSSHFNFRQFSSDNSIGLFSRQKRINELEKAFFKALPKNFRKDFFAEISNGKFTGELDNAVLALNILKGLPLSTLDLPIIQGDLGGLGSSSDNIWKDKHLDIVSARSLPGLSDKYHTVTGSKVTEVVKNYTFYNKGFHLVEIGCLSGHDARLICKDFAEQGKKVSSYTGIDINKAGLIAGACLQQHEPWIDEFMMVHGNSEILKNFQTPHLRRIGKEKKLILCNKLISAVPPIDGERILKNISTYMNPRDCALVNFTIHDAISKKIIKKISKKKNSSFRAEKENGKVNIYEKRNVHVQTIFEKDYLKKMLKTLNLAVISVLPINELKESAESSNVENYTVDIYNRDFALLVIKEESI
ncbi:hypothetical protein [Candidatus Neptunochlamydia vexilliferae]|uniref:Methyltransferase domain-containing protein n=1 Tax=Candidatus Neptunichlamydia vexilliferae TaxID=1651774 RepID=A0ABS0B003_9BACT|nr:hypothetical protein [Candidatus Neptunochlamydia vexilliferae]MBF5059713.1 hypothetical protein [Candidatus Neptunochlamydia vexilliferae]